MKLPMKLSLVLTFASATALRLPSTALPTTPLRAGRSGRTGLVVAQADGDSAGKGFGTSTTNKYAETTTAEERGAAALAEMRKQAAEGGPPQVPRAEPEQYIPTQKEKDTVVYGLAGFLILGGIISLLVGGSLWEATEPAPPSESAGLFGFSPTASEIRQVQEAKK